jgi:hypothetical protein
MFMSFLVCGYYSYEIDDANEKVKIILRGVDTITN